MTLSEVVDVPGECGVERERPSRAVVAPAVVHDGVQVVEPTEDPGEAGRPVEGPVDEHDDREGAGRTFREVLGDGELAQRGHFPLRLSVAPGGRHMAP